MIKETKTLPKLSKENKKKCDKTKFYRITPLKPTIHPRFCESSRYPLRGNLAFKKMSAYPYHTS